MDGPVLAVDPGTAKCGIAVVDRNLTVLHRAVIPTSELASTLSDLCARFRPRAIVMGGGTGSAPVRRVVEDFVLEGTAPSALEGAAPSALEVVEESHTSEAARARYVAEVPARGLRKLVPRSLRTPETPYDDFVAVILAERWWQARR